MSTTTVSFNSTSRDIELEALRRREAEAREAARQAARRAEVERRREEALKRRIKVANDSITTQETRFQSLVSRLDEAARRLPDLTLSAPKLSTISSDIAEDPTKLEAYAARLQAEVGAFSRGLDNAIAEAERLLDRRIRKAAAWRSAADLEQQAELLVQRCRDAAARLQENLVLEESPAKPQSDAELEAVQAYQAVLQHRLNDLKQRHTCLHARVQSREHAIALSGSQVATRSADEALQRHDAEQQTRAVAALSAYLATELDLYQLNLADLSSALRLQLDAALEQAHAHDWRENITRWLAREQQQRDGMAQALELLQSVPDLVADDRHLSLRWASLAAQLQRIANGLEDLTPNVRREHEQLHADARRLVNTAFTKADWVRAMREQGFEVLEDEAGQDLVVVDLEHPECWLKATPLEAEHGGFGALLELETDVEGLANEDQLTESVCTRLTNVAAAAGADVTTEAEVVERKRRIERARRPKALSQRL